MSSQGSPDDTCGGSSRAEQHIPANLPSSGADGITSRADEGNSVLPKSKRNACALCRRRRVKCDGASPCGTCAKLNQDCTYFERRKRSGPKRGYVKGLEAKLAEVQNLLKQKKSRKVGSPLVPATRLEEPRGNFQPQNSGYESLYTGNFDPVPDIIESHSVSPMISDNLYNAPENYEFSWEMIELGLDEPLPPQSTIDALTKIYFTKIHPSYPIIHQSRFLATLNLASGIRPSIALRYAMWMLAASSSEEYMSAHSYFYLRAKKYAEADETAGRHKYLNLRHAQAWLLIALYEYKMMHFPNATMTTCRAIRLTQIMGLHRLDGPGSDIKQSLPRPFDWIDKEERRRTFWTAFAFDRYASIGTGWPMVIDEKDIVTNLPSSEEAFALNTEEASSISLSDAMLPGNAASLSPFAGVVVIVCMKGRTLVHLQRPCPDEDGEDLNGEFWRTHRQMDNMLSNTSLYLPSHLRLPTSSFNANVIFLNMNLHSAAICLHQGAIFKAEKLGLSTNILEESKLRCIAAATEIASIMKTVAHMDLSVLNVVTPFSLYVATRVFSRVLKSQPENDNARSSLQFLLSALLAIKSTCPLAESYLIQLDLEGIGLSAMQQDVGLSSDFERSMAEVSINDSTNDSSWITFVSPLVKIVEETDGSIPLSGSTVSNADEVEGSFMSSLRHSSVPINPVAVSHSSDSYGNVQSGNLDHDQQPTMSNLEFDPMNLSAEMLDSLAGMGPDSWDRF